MFYFMFCFQGGCRQRVLLLPPPDGGALRQQRSAGRQRRACHGGQLRTGLKNCEKKNVLGIFRFIFSFSFLKDNLELNFELG